MGIIQKKDEIGIWIIDPMVFQQVSQGFISPFSHLLQPGSKGI